MRFLLLFFSCSLLYASPPLSLPQHAKPLIVLDAGHGGSDEGAKIKFFKEKKLTLATVLTLRKYLDAMGYRTLLTRSRDLFISLERRASIANKTKGVLFVSVHFNACAKEEIKGVEIFYFPGLDKRKRKASKQLAHSILSNVVRSTHAPSRGVKEGDFLVIRETRMPAVLVEGGFLTNHEERALLRDEKYLEKIAKGIAVGIDRYMSL